MLYLATFLAIVAGVVIGQLLSSAIMAWRAHREWQRLEKQASWEAMRIRTEELAAEHRRKATVN